MRDPSSTRSAARARRLRHGQRRRLLDGGHGTAGPRRRAPWPHRHGRVDGWPIRCRTDLRSTMATAASALEAEPTVNAERYGAAGLSPRSWSRRGARPGDPSRRHRAPGRPAPPLGPLAPCVRALLPRGGGRSTRLGKACLQVDARPCTGGHDEQRALPTC